MTATESGLPEPSISEKLVEIASSFTLEGLKSISPQLTEALDRFSGSTAMAPWDFLTTIDTTRTPQGVGEALASVMTGAVNIQELAHEQNDEIQRVYEAMLGFKRMNVRPDVEVDGSAEDK